MSEGCHPSQTDAPPQWHDHADWPAGLCPRSDDKKDADEEEDQMDVAPFASGQFETYDEIQEATGQVSQRPLVHAPPDEFAPGTSELSWPQTVSPTSQSSSVPPSSSPPLTSPSSPLSGTSYTGKVHYCHCGKAYTLKSMRDRHVKMQHLNLRPFACPVCSKSFKMKHHLTKHVKTHGSLRPYECVLCGKKIVWRDSFLKHQARCQRLSAATPASITVEVSCEREDDFQPDDGPGRVKKEKTAEY